MTALADLEVHELTLQPDVVLELDVRSTRNDGSIEPARERACATLMEVVARHALVAVGPPRAIYRDWNDSESHFTVAIPIRHAPTSHINTAGVKAACINEQQVLQFVHRGPYDGIAETYAKIANWLRSHGALSSRIDWSRYAPMWEEFPVAPAGAADSELTTRIYLTLP